MDAKELLISPIAHMAPAQAIEGLTGEQAAARSAGAPHSVVEIVAHMIHWQEWFLERCAGAAIPPVSTASLGWPAAGAGDWATLRARFRDGLEQAVKVASDETARARRLDPPIEFPPLANYTVGDAVTHMAIHNSHHLGQIVTLRQILGAWPPPEGSYTW